MATTAAKTKCYLIYQAPTSVLVDALEAYPPYRLIFSDSLDYTGLKGGEMPPSFYKQLLLVNSEPTV